MKYKFQPINKNWVKTEIRRSEDLYNHSYLNLSLSYFEYLTIGAHILTIFCSAKSSIGLAHVNSLSVIILNPKYQ